MMVIVIVMSRTPVPDDFCYRLRTFPPDYSCRTFFSVCVCSPTGVRITVLVSSSLCHPQCRHHRLRRHHLHQEHNISSSWSSHNLRFACPVVTSLAAHSTILSESGLVGPITSSRNLTQRSFEDLRLACSFAG